MALEDITKIENYFLERKEYRNYALFVVGLTIGLRISDLTSPRIGDFIHEDGTFKTHFGVFEQKTGKHNNPKITKRAQEAITLYLEHRGDFSLDEYLFKSRKGDNEPISGDAVYNLFVKVQKELGLKFHFSTHSLRKTFAYWMIRNNKGNQVILTALQDMLDHADQSVTLHYAGITSEEHDALYDGWAKFLEENTEPAIASRI